MAQRRYAEPRLTIGVCEALYLPDWYVEGSKPAKA